MRWDHVAVAWALGSAVPSIGAAQSPPAPPVESAAQPLARRPPRWVPRCARRPGGCAPAAPASLWYGWQILLVAGGSVAVGGTLAVVSRPGDGAVVAGLGFVLGGPLAHWSHGHAGRGFASLGINLGLPLLLGWVGGGIACGVGSCGGGGLVPEGALAGGAIGGTLGILGALAIDVAALAYDEPAPRRAAARWSIAPDLRLSADRGTAGIQGWF